MLSLLLENTVVIACVNDIIIDTLKSIFPLKKKKTFLIFYLTRVYIYTIPYILVEFSHFFLSTTDIHNRFSHVKIVSTLNVFLNVRFYRLPFVFKQHTIFSRLLFESFNYSYIT